MPDTLENLFLSLSDKTRLRLLGLMADGEVSVGYLADTLGESQPKISRHLAYLRNAGLVSTRRDGKWIYYGIDRPADATAAHILDTALGKKGIPAEPVHAREEPVSIAEIVDTPRDIDPEAIADDWRPEELEVYLL